MTVSSNKTEYSEVYRKYAMKLPLIIVVTSVGFFDVKMINAAFTDQLEPLFYYCYAFFFLGLILILEMLQKPKLIIPGLPIMAAVLLIIFRDRVLTVNIICALLFVFIILFLLQEKWERMSFAAFLIFVVVNVCFCIATGTEEKAVILCLMVGIFYCMAHFAGRDVDYRIPVTLAFFVVAFFPVSDAPIRWTYVKNAFSKVVDFTDDTFNEITYRIGGIFDIENSYSGYSEMGRLGGALSKKAREELLFTKNGGVKSLYLKGSEYSLISKGGLDGKKNLSEDYNEWFVVLINSMMDAGINDKEARCFIRVESAGIKYEYLRTHDVIYPSNLLSIDPQPEMGQMFGKGFSYRVTYAVIDYASPYYKKLLETSGEDTFHSYEEVSDYTHDVLRLDMSKFMSEEEYSRIAEKLSDASYKDEMSPYLDTSMTTDEIKDLSNEITAGCQSDYEKAKAIERYLRQYNYDLGVDLRSSDNYVEEFLFETKRGYCVHYASAMVLLLRNAGIPARFVNGYLYNTENEAVMSSDAHAWVEAYIDGVGWMSFEPTVVMSIAEDNTWGLVVKEDSDAAEYYQREESTEIMYPEETEATVNNASEKDINKKIAGQILLYVLIIAGSFALLLLIVFGLKKLWFHMLPPERKLYEIVKKTCRDIEKNLKSEEDLKLLKSNSSSIYDYLKYVENDNEKIRLNKLFDLYYRVRFRGDSVSSNELYGISVKVPEKS